MIAMSNHFPTGFAKVRLFSCVSPQVHVEIGALCKRFLAERTGVGPFTCVDSQMYSQMVPPCKLLATAGAFERPLSHVNLIHVSDQITVPGKHSATDTTHPFLHQGWFVVHRNCLQATLTAV